jgi:myo-inositol-1(or 4)-monophosphatase
MVAIYKLISGTTNFVHGVPYVAISIGFTLSRTPTIGIVLNPFTAQLYSAIASHGSYLTVLSNDLGNIVSKSRLPIYPPQTLDLPSSVIAIEFGSDRQGNNFDVKMSTFANLASLKGGMVHGLRAYGSAALNLCSVASGYIDAYWEGGCWEWDVCAGWVVLKEAGGHIVHGNPKDTVNPEDVLEEPDLCGRVYLGVRKGQNDNETSQWIKKFWGLIGGELEYGR